ncbi:hypothetical protein HHI36_012698 [Cryptolaemus montrouzieri]|uniref:C2H2-type domain-containing protein n=1 Tax=Cryptolaemus montrouzieri TaxID=559131 RepID=A0ABD2NG63_9CUCU
MNSDGKSKHRKCTECGSLFSTISNLRKHVRQKHPGKLEEVAPLIYKNKNNFKFSCEICDKNFNHERYFRFHMKSHVKPDDNIKEETGNKPSKKCPICSILLPSAAEILGHFFQEHDITISTTEMEFTSIYEFEEWLRKMEKSTQSKFVKKGTKTSRKHVKTSYFCHRSGHYSPTGNGLRCTKMKGSVKINGYCPASIKLLQLNDGVCQVHFIETHVGHSSDTNLEYLYLSKDEKQKIAAQIADNIPFDDILQGVENSMSDVALERIHLLKRKDLYNISRCFNLASGSIKYSSDALNIENWVNEMRRGNNCVLFYKPQGSVLTEKGLENKDFVLIIMTLAQCELFKKYSGGYICVDHTHGRNSQNLELHTIFIKDDANECFPCAFCISNRADKVVMLLFFSHIKEQAGIVLPKVFMSDIEDSYFEAWKEIMGDPGKWHFSSWHLELTWQSNLNEITSEELQVLIYNQLRNLQEEENSEVFQTKINDFCELICNNSETKEFAKFFIDNFLKSYKSWANSYKTPTEIKSNIHLEQMHDAIKYIYLDENHSKSLEESLSAIMFLVRDKFTDKLALINEGKLWQPEDIVSRHKASLFLDPNSVIPSEDGWKVPYEKNNTMCFIQEINPECTCHLNCSYCNICIHKYCCSCVDSTIKWNICKHIHLLVSWMKGEDSDDGTLENSDEDLEENNEVIIIHTDGLENNGRVEVIVKKPSKRTLVTLLNEEKEELKKQFCSLVNSIDTTTQLEKVKKMMSPIYQCCNTKELSKKRMIRKRNVK